MVEVEEVDLRRMYEGEGMTIRQIANCYHINHSTIWRRLLRYGIERREPTYHARKRGLKN